MFIFFSLIVAFMWAIQSIVNKHILKKIHSHTLLVLGGIVYAASVFMYWLVQVKVQEQVRQDMNRHIGWKMLGYIVFSGLVGGFLANLLYFGLLKKYPAHMVTAVTYCSPAITAILAYMILKEKMNSKTVLGICLVVTGLVILGLSDRDL